MRVSTRLLIGAGLALVVTGVAGAMVAQPAQAITVQGAQTPRSWAYELRNGQRVPRVNRVTNDDGSWREELRQGTCTTVKEKTANGDYNETRKCD